MASDPARPATAELANQSDADLLGLMALAEQRPACARAAWEVFYRRHADYLYRVSLRAYADLVGGEAGVVDLVAEAFRAAFVGAQKFDPGGITDPRRLGLRARAWLGWIVRRMVQDILRGRGRLPARNLAPEYWQQVPGPSRPDPTPSAKEAAVREAIEQLSEREQLVLRTTIQWYRADKTHQRLPNEVAADLARTLATTPENLRQIRRRAMKKVAEYVRGCVPNVNEREQADGPEA
jgi:RNA polymerase sigma factor (sigma-70 family)